MTKMYYRGARAAILCYDVTDKSSFEKIRYWIGELQENEQVTIIHLIFIIECGSVVEHLPHMREIWVRPPVATDIIH